MVARLVLVLGDQLSAGLSALKAADRSRDIVAMGEVEGTTQFETPGGNTMNATFLAPQPITADNLSVVVDAGWITQDALCQGVTDGPAPCN